MKNTALLIVDMQNDFALPGAQGAGRRTGSDTVMSSGQSDARLGDEIHAGGSSSRRRNAADGCPQP